jgi:hypothetical protein
MGIDEINEGGIWTGDDFISWDDIRLRVVATYPKDNMTDVKAVRGIVEELRGLADDIEKEY